jgi:hypothetical protein
MKPWKRGRYGARLKDWLLTGPGGGVSRMPNASERATGIKRDINFIINTVILSGFYFTLMTDRRK